MRSHRRPPAALRYSTAAMEQLGAECSARERRADEAAREVMAYLKCVYMRAHVGDEFEGVITGVVEFGFFVQLANLQVDGLVHASELHGDRFDFDAGRCAWIGRRTHRTYRLGDAGGGAPEAGRDARAATRLRARNRAAHGEHRAHAHAAPRAIAMAEPHTGVWRARGALAAQAAPRARAPIVAAEQPRRCAHRGHRRARPGRGHQHPERRRPQAR